MLITFKQLVENKEVDSIIPLDYDLFDEYRDKLLYKDTIVIVTNTIKISVCISRKTPNVIFELELDGEDDFNLFNLVESIAGLYKFIYSSAKYKPDRNLKLLFLRSINYDKNKKLCTLNIL